MAMATTFEILPAMDLRGGKVVRLKQGDFERETTFSDDAVAVAEGFAAVGARWLHVVDLDGARSGTPAHASAIAGIMAAVGDRVQIEVAGGLRDERSVAQVLAAGATRVVVGTRAIEDPAFAGRLIATNGPDRIVAAVDIRGDRAVGHGWSTDDPGFDAVEVIRRLAGEGVVTFEVTAIDRDGLLEGPDLLLYERLVSLAPGSILGSGGVATVSDVRAVRGVGCAGVIVGRALYEGRLDLAEMLAVAMETN